MQSQSFDDAERFGVATLTEDETKLAEQRLNAAETNMLRLITAHLNESDARLTFRLAAIELKTAAVNLGIRRMFDNLATRGTK